MEARTVPRAAPAGVSGIVSPRLLRVASDAHLVDLIRQGRGAAFEALYDRHHRAILSFCRHMLGSADEAEDAVQHTFLAAYNDLVATDRPMHLRAWLFTIARNRCYSMLRARREQPVAEVDGPVTEGLAAQVERRQDLRDLVVDLGRLPDDQRAALVLSEMDALSHEQIAAVLEVPKDKVKALVFQARESLIASRAARETSCAEIREQLANLHGGALRRSNLRRHLRECTGCREFRQEVDRQRRQMRLLLPVVPTLALKEAVLGGTVGGSATATAVGGGTVAGSLFKGGIIKGLIGAAIAGVGTAGTIVAVHDFQIGASGGAHREQTTASRHTAPGSTSTPAAARSAAAPVRVSALTSTHPGPLIATVRSGWQSRGYDSTQIAVLHPLAPIGLAGHRTVINPLVPSAPETGVVPAPAKQSPASGNAPYLGNGAFGTGRQPTSTSESSGQQSPSASTGAQRVVSSPPTYTARSSGTVPNPAGAGTTTRGGGPAADGSTGSTGSSGSGSGRTTTTTSSSSGTSSSSTTTTTTTTTKTTTSSTPPPTTTTSSAPPPTGTSGTTGTSSGYGGGTNSGPHGR